MSIKRAISVDQILKMKFTMLNFTEEWYEHIGIPQNSGVWIVWGNSSNGKTNYCLALAKYLTLFGKVTYNSREEGARATMQRSMLLNNMKEVSRRFCLLNEPMADLIERLGKPKSAQIIFVDSFQHAGLTKKDYLQLKEEFPNKLFIFVSHAEGKEPEGKVAKFVRYDADVKIRIEGHKAFAASRYGGGKVKVISHDKANEYWNKEKPKTK